MSRERPPDWAKATANALMQALRERDPYTYGHCRRVSRNARYLAKAAGLNEKEQLEAEYSSLFHDIGKIAIPDHILFKPMQLSAQEEEIMKTHPIRSVEVIQPLCKTSFFKNLIPGIKHHHEHIDGCGYPDGIAGDEIPLTSRIILIADTFDAMTTSRPYRKALSHEIAYKELKQFAGRQFDAQLVKTFLQAHPGWGQLDEELTEEFITAHRPRAKAA